MNEWRLASGELVVDRPNSHLQPTVVNVLPEALGRLNSQGRQFFKEEVSFTKEVGETICVATDERDEIVYAVRPNRGGHSRFAKNRKPQPTTKMVIVLRKSDDGTHYLIITAFFGSNPEPEPWDEKNFASQPNPVVARENAWRFWSSHALVWESTPVIPGTETTDLPPSW